MRIKDIKFLISSLLVFLFSSNLMANQLQGCYRFSDDSIMTLSTKYEESGDVVEFSKPVEGVLIDRGDGHYSVAMNVPSRPNLDLYKFELYDDHDSGKISGNAVFRLRQTTESIINIEWNRDTFPSRDIAEAGIKYRLASTDSDNDGMSGSLIENGVFAGKNVAFDINLEKVTTDTNQLQGCHAFNKDSLIYMTSSSGEQTSKHSLSGAIMSKGDGSYWLIPDNNLTDSYDMNFRFTQVVDDSLTNQIVANGYFSHFGFAETPMTLSWEQNQLAFWDINGENSTFDMASLDTDGDSYAGSMVGGTAGFNYNNIALDINLSAREVSPDETGQYSVGFDEYTLADTTIYHPNGDLALDNIEVHGVVRYPANIAGEGVPLSAELQNNPIIFMAHGWHDPAYNIRTCSITTDIDSLIDGDVRIPSLTGYNYIADRLASQGFIVVSIDFSDINSTFGQHGDIDNKQMSNNELRSRLIKHHMNIWQGWNSTSAGVFGSRFTNSIDIQNIGLLGHSRGGKAIVGAEYLNRIENWGFGITSLVSVAPISIFSKNIGSSDDFIFEPPAVPILVINTSADGDTGALGIKDISRLRTMANGSDSITGLWIYGGRHSSFNTVWMRGSDFDFRPSEAPGYYIVGGQPTTYKELNVCNELHPVSVPLNNLLDPVKQQSLTRSSVIAFYRQHMKNEDFSYVFTGSVALSSADGVESYWLQNKPDDFYIDSFENMSVQVSDIGGTVETTNNLISLDEDAAISLNSSIAHTDTDGLLQVGWDGSSTITWTLPAAYSDVSSYKSFVFQAGQLTESQLNSAGEFKKIIVEFIDIFGVSEQFDIREVSQGIPYPSIITSDYNVQPPKGSNKTILTNNEISFDRFKLIKKRRRDVVIDLSSLAEIKFHFEGKGLIVIDNVGFSK